MANQTCVRTRLNRIRIVKEQLSVCEENYKTIDHVVRDCNRFQNERIQLLYLWLELILQLQYVACWDVSKGRDVGLHGTVATEAKCSLLEGYGSSACRVFRVSPKFVNRTLDSLG
jgi:hypothetical protein